MVEFKIEKIWNGWLAIQTPDDIDVSIETEGGSDTFMVALSDLLELYGYAVHETPCHLLVGTGTVIEVETSDDGIRLRKHRIDVETTFEELRSSLEPALATAFRHKDQHGDTDIRTEQLGYVQQDLEDEGIPLDLIDLYESLVTD